MANMQPTWSWQPGHIARMGEACTVVDEDNDNVRIPEGALVLTCGHGMMVLMKSGEIFRVDELDALVMEYDAELLS